MNSLICLALVIAGGDGPALDVDQFVALLREKSRPLKSVAFLYEGEMKFVDRGNQDRPLEEFQGSFLYRADKAYLYDHYLRGPNPLASVRRIKKSSLRKNTERLELLTDRRRPDDLRSQVRRSHGSGISGLEPMESPRDLLLKYELIEWFEFRPDWYSHDGWEEIGGRHCLRIRYTPHDQSEDPAKKPIEQQDYRLYWIDVERSAQVVRLDYLAGGKLVYRIDGVELKSYPLADGTTYWLPACSRRQDYQYQDEWSSKPIIERTNAVVIGSEQLNAEFPDSLFTVLRESALPTPDELANRSELRRRFETQLPPPPEPRLPTDPVSVRRRLDDRLAEADRQATELHASSAAETSSAWASTVPILLGGLGAVLIVGAGWLAKRRAG